MKTLLSVCLAGLLTSCAIRAAAINFATGGSVGHMFISQSGGRLPVGSIVRMGTAADGTPATFVEFARTSINNVAGALPYNGFLRDGVTISSVAVADAIKGKQVYLFVYDTTDPSQLPFADWGLFTSP